MMASPAAMSVPVAVAAFLALMHLAVPRAARSIAPYRGTRWRWRHSRTAPFSRRWRRRRSHVAIHRAAVAVEVFLRCHDVVVTFI
jgi:hypothetical protein